MNRNRIKPELCIFLAFYFQQFVLNYLMDFSAQLCKFELGFGLSSTVCMFTELKFYENPFCENQSFIFTLITKL